MLDRVTLGGHYYARSTDKEVLKRASYGGVVTTILKFLLEKGLVDLVISVKGDRSTGGKPVFITKAETIYELAGVHAVAPLNMAKLLRDYVKKGERIALTVKPCEAKAIEYLISKEYFKRDNVFLVGLNCGGLFDSYSLARKLTELRIDPAMLRDVRYWRDHIELRLSDGKIVNIDYIEGINLFGYREACKRCLTHTPDNTDISCGYWGLLPGYENYTYTIPLTKKGAEVLNSMIEEGLLEVMEAPEEGIALRENIINIINKSAEMFRKHQFRELDKVGIENILSSCIECLECWRVCPIRSDKEITVWKERVPPVLWQVSVITYMLDKCVGCGSCDDVCPVKIPFSLIIERIRKLREDLGV